MTKYVIGVDGGGSKTRMVLGDVCGNILADITTSGSNYQHIGYNAAIQVLGDGIKSLLADAGVGKETIAHIFMGLSGVDLPEDAACYTRICQACCMGIPFSVVNDIWLVLRSENLCLPCGVVICGTGANAATLGRDGSRHTLRQLCYELGSYGGGVDLACEAFHAAFRSNEATGPKTGLEERLAVLYGKKSLTDCIPLFYPQRLLSTKELSCAAKVVFELAAAGDAVCQQLLFCHGQQLANSFIGTATRAACLGDPLPVVLGGSLLIQPETQLLKGFQETATAAIPHIRIIISTRPPVAGAYLSALDAIGEEISQELMTGFNQLRPFPA